MGSVLTKFVNNQTTMVNGYDNQRLQTSGVSSDEELQKMIKYQHAYNAASRYVNVVSEMMEHLFNIIRSLMIICCRGKGSEDHFVSARQT